MPLLGAPQNFREQRRSSVQAGPRKKVLFFSLPDTAEMFRWCLKKVTGNAEEFSTCKGVFLFGLMFKLLSYCCTDLMISWGNI
jgi:hypothetical protein